MFRRDMEALPPLVGRSTCRVGGAGPARRTIPLALKVAAFFAAFTALTQAGYLFAFQPYAGIGVFWPSAGFCLAVLLLEPVQAWPAYLLAIFVGDLLEATRRGVSPVVAVTWALVAVGEPLCSAFLLRRGRPPFRIQRLRDLVALVGIGALVAPGILSLLATAVAVHFGAARSWLGSWATWWLGDALGVTMVAPLVLAWAGRTRRFTPADQLLGVALLGAVGLTAQAMFGGPAGETSLRMVPGFLTFPLLLWMAIRYELRGVTAAGAVLNVVAAWQTTRGRGFFGEGMGSATERLVTLQAYLSCGTLSSMALAAVLMERRIVMENLLANAWKFTSHHASARIEVGRVRTGDETVFYVRDDGAGFDERYAGKLFQPFERLHGPGEFPGTGIGLATVARIVGRHGGRVWATGEIERGATFFFTVPGEHPEGKSQAVEPATVKTPA